MEDLTLDGTSSSPWKPAHVQDFLSHYTPDGIPKEQKYGLTSYLTLIDKVGYLLCVLISLILIGYGSTNENRA
jgi:hypothetical protein